MTNLTAIDIGSVHIKSNNLLNVTMEEVSTPKENPILDLCLGDLDGNILLIHIF